MRTTFIFANARNHRIARSPAAVATFVVGVLVILSVATNYHQGSTTSNASSSSRSLVAAGAGAGDSFYHARDTTFDGDKDGVAGSENDRVNVAWVMGYPGSGTEFVLRTVEAAAHTPEGEKMDRPPVYVLPTECGGAGDSRAPPQSYVMTPPDFVRACLVNAHFTLNRELVRRVVHLVRNPLDNVVERFRSERRENRREEGEDETAPNPNDEDNPSAFAVWCAEADGRFVAEEASVYSRAATELSATVPCHAEFFKYVQWHNNLVAVKNFRELPTRAIHYGSFRVDLGHTVTNLLRFLSLPPDLPPDRTPPFNFGAYAETYYTEDQRRAVGVFLREFASVETWTELERYFPGLPEKTMDEVPPLPKEEEETV